MARRSRKRTIAPQASPAIISHPIRSNKNKTVHPGVDSVMMLQRTIGNRAVGSLLHSGILQAKLKVGSPGDRFERQADAVANQVVSMPDPSVQRTTDDEKKMQTSPIASTITPLVQTSAEEKEEVQKAPSDDKKEEEVLQRAAIPEDEKKEQPVMRKSISEDEELLVQGKVNPDTSTAKSGNISPHIEAGLSVSGSGRPLSESDRAYFEPRFGTSFEKVRLHTDSKSAQLSSDLNAQAFNIGKNVYFGTGKYDTGSSAGKRLMAHELTHVVQQGNSNFSQCRKTDKQSINPLIELRSSPDFNLQRQKTKSPDTPEMAERRKLLPNFCRNYEFSMNVQDGIVKAMLAFSPSQLNKMLSAGVRFWDQGIPPELESENIEFDIKHSGLARYIPQLRIIQLDKKLSVENLRHELAHAWDNVRVITSPVALEKLPPKKRDSVIVAKQKMWSDTTLKEMFEAYKKRVPRRELSFDGPSTSEGLSTKSVREFYAEGYAVFHGSNDFSKARLLRYAPELYDLLEKEAK